jgi:AcrR family transcriptional regulator
MDAISARQKRPARAEVRQRLIDAGAQLLSEHGFEASVEAITERAGFSRGAFYSNFSSRDELFLEAVEQRTRRRVAELTDAFSHARNLGALIATIEARSRKRGARREFEQHMRFLFHALARDELRASLDEFERSRQRTFTDIVIRLAPELAEKPSTATQLGMLLSALDQGLAIQTYLNGKPPALDPEHIIIALSALGPKPHPS